MKIALKYGRGQVEAELPEANFGGWLLPRSEADTADESALVAEALEKPLGTPRLRNLVRPGEKICLVTSDITRPCPSAKLLPPVLEELSAAGIPYGDIVIVLALGIHRGHTEAEKAALVGPEVMKRYRVADHDPNRCRHLGRTSRGTPVDIFEEVAAADRRLALGNVEYHYFAGYSGGAKALMPGVSSAAAIQNNHRMMTQPAAKAGRLADNPVRLDIDDVANHLSVDFILNVILGEDKKIKAAFAGHHLEAHRAACRRLDEICQATVPAPGAEVVLVSAGGFPKDINVYQAQKALDNAARAVRPGGVIVWVGACDEGYGEEVFARWLREASTPGDLLTRVKADFQLGGHKAAAIALVLKKAKVFMVSNLSEEMASGLFVRPSPDLPGALASALAEAGPAAKVLVMPYGGSVLPQIL
jgi:nickel-dependent lactate racemase